MLKSLIILRLKGMFLKQTNSSKNKKSSIGRVLLFVFLFAYVGVVFIGMFGVLFSTLIEPLHSLNIDWLYFAIMALMIVMLCFVGSVFITYHEIYEAKDNELLMSMPIRNRDILLSRIFTILLLNYIYELLVAVPAFYVYITTLGMTILHVLLFLLVILTLPLFVLALSCLFGWILAHILVHIRNRNIFTVVFSLLFMFVYFYLINYAENYVIWLVSHGETIANAIKNSVFPLYHLAIALQDGNMISFLIYLVCAILPFIVVIYLLSTNFIKLATSKPKVKKIEYKEKVIKVNTIQKALLLREIKHLTSNAMVMLNGVIGVVFCLIAAIALIIYVDDLNMIFIYMPEMLEFKTPIICLMMMTMCSMNIISASLISLEGNRLWILKSLPIDSRDILLSKLALQFVVCVPPLVILAIMTCIIFQVTLLDTLLVVITPILVTLFIDLMGLLLNLLKPKFDWVNETICIKQSMPSMITMFCAMGLTFMIVVIYIYFLINYISVNTYMYLLIVLFGVLDFCLYQLLQTWGVKRFNEL